VRCHASVSFPNAVSGSCREPTESTRTRIRRAIRQQIDRVRGEAPLGRQGHDSRQPAGTLRCDLEHGTGPHGRPDQRDPPRARPAQRRSDRPDLLRLVAVVADCLEHRDRISVFGQRPCLAAPCACVVVGVVGEHDPDPAAAQAGRRRTVEAPRGQRLPPASGRRAHSSGRGGDGLARDSCRLLVWRRMNAATVAARGDHSVRVP
jgi:hypothetical protein